MRLLLRLRLRQQRVRRRDEPARVPRAFLCVRARVFACLRACVRMRVRARLRLRTRVWRARARKISDQRLPRGLRTDAPAARPSVG